MLIPRDANGEVLQVFTPSENVHRLSLGRTASHTPTFDETTLVRVYAKAACHLVVGPGAVATKRHTTFEPGSEVFAIPEGMRLSAIAADGASGTLEITEAL